jgi:diketogulonate reductase-like aldo/keto reductase
MTPALIYGTAWKEDRTAALVTQALDAGFRAIDTANQRKHYHEAGVGEALLPYLAAGRRAELWLQTKYTYAAGQDARLPYDPAAPIAAQVEQSCRSSLVHLGVERVDSVLLHGPSRGDGLGRDDHEAWRALEGLVDAGSTVAIGASNVTARQVDELVALARVRPRYVQNRCYASRGWDRDVRAACDGHGIAYQAFSLLTANRATCAHREVVAIARGHRVTVAQVVLRFAQLRGMIPLSGTNDAQHAHDDVELGALELTEAELHAVEHAR